MTLRILIYQRDDNDRMIFRVDGIQDELGKSTGDGVKFRVAVQFSGIIITYEVCVQRRIAKRHLFLLKYRSSHSTFRSVSSLVFNTLTPERCQIFLGSHVASLTGHPLVQRMFLLGENDIIKERNLTQYVYDSLAFVSFCMLKNPHQVFE